MNRGVMLPQITREDHYGVLVCPACGSAYLHHAAVRVFDRGEDQAKMTLTTVSNGFVSTGCVAAAPSGNPSSRRDGIRIEFECEGCDASLSLGIAQHKGETHLQWDVTWPGMEGA